MTYENDEITLTCRLLNRTAEALFVETGGVRVWIPRSQIRVILALRDGEVELTIPGWLARRKELT